MDPQSATATAVEITNKAIDIVQEYHEHHSKWSNTSPALLSLIKECDIVAFTLQEIQNALVACPDVAVSLTLASDASGRTFNSIIGACQVTFHILHDKVAGFIPPVDEDKTEIARGWKRPAIWNDNEIRAFATNISRLVSAHTLLVQTLLLYD